MTRSAEHRTATTTPTHGRGFLRARSLPAAVRSGVWVPGLVLAVAIAATYAPGLRNDFVEWDDDAYIRDNAHLWSEDGLRNIWFSRALPQYYPVTFTSHWLEFRLWERHATGYFVVNVALHATAAFLVYALGRALGASRPAAWLAAAVFALHPLQVGTVAWLAERKNLLANLFGLSSFLWYLRHRRAGGETSYVLSLLAFVLAVLSKSVALAFVPSFWLADRLVAGRRGWSGVLRLVPFVLLAVGPLLVTGEREAALAEMDVPLLLRPAQAAAALWFYCAKFVAPVVLLPVYPRWTIRATEPIWWAALAGLVAAVAAVVLWRRRLDRVIGWGLAHFVVAMLPAIGLVHFGFLAYAPVADHLVYFGMVGLALVVGTALGWLAETTRRRGWTALVPTASVVLLLVLAARSAAQVRVWRDPETLWTFTLRHNPRCAPALTGLATVAERRGQREQAFQYLYRALEAAPDHFYVHSNIGALLAKSARLPEALEHCRRAVELGPHAVQARTNYANALLDSGQPAEALEQARAGLAHAPHDAAAHTLAGAALLALRDPAAALPHVDYAVRLNSQLPVARIQRAAALHQLGRLEEAAAEYRDALTRWPDHPVLNEAYADLLVARGDLAAAAGHYAAALRGGGDSAAVRGSLGAVLVQLGRVPEGLEHLRVALQREPQNPNGHFMLAVGLAQLGHISEARIHARRAVALAPSDPQSQQLLATLEAAAGPGSNP